jgi:hypothetical protein
VRGRVLNLEAAESRGSPVIPVNRGLYERLVRAAKSGMPITYAEVGRLLELSLDYPPHRAEMMQLLGVITRHEAAKGRPMLTSVVLLKDEATPGKNFYRTGQELGLVQQGEDEVSFAIRQMNETFAFWGSKDAPSIEEALRAGDEQVPSQAFIAPPLPLDRLGEGDTLSEVDTYEGEPETEEEELPAGSPPVFGQISSVRGTPRTAARPDAATPGMNYGGASGPPSAGGLKRSPVGAQAAALLNGGRPTSTQPALGRAPLRPPPAFGTAQKSQPASGGAQAAGQPVFGGSQVARSAAGHPIESAVPAPQVVASTAPDPAAVLRPTTPLAGNRAIEDAAIRWVMQLEQAAGRLPVDRRHDPTFPADIDSPPRRIEVKAIGTSTRGWFLPLEVSQMEEARRNRNFYVYVVEGTRQGDPTKFTLKVLSGTRLQQLLLGAKERRYFEVPWPVQHYDQTTGLEALSGHGPDLPTQTNIGTPRSIQPNGPARPPTPRAESFHTEG